MKGSNDVQGFYDRLEKYVDDKGISLNQLCQESEIDQGNFSRSKKQMRLPSRRVIRNLAKSIGVTVEWLTTGCGLCGLEGNEALDVLGDEFEQRREAPSRDVHQDTPPEGESAPTLKEVLQLLSAGGLDAEGRISYKGLKNLMALQKELELKDEMLRQKDDEIAFLRQLLSQK